MRHRLHRRPGTGPIGRAAHLKAPKRSGYLLPGGSRTLTRLLVVVLVVAGVATTSPAHAVDDLQGLIDGAEAGSELLVPAGTYSPIVIDKPITLQGIGNPVIDGHGEGTVVTINADDVTITGFTIRSSGRSLDHEDSGVFAQGARITVTHNVFEDVLFGIYLRLGEDSVITHNVIGAKDLESGRRGDPVKLWESPRTLFADNSVQSGRDVVLWYSEGIVIRDNVIQDGRYGLHFMYSHDAMVSGNTLRDNSVGAFLMYSYNLTFNDNLVVGNHGPSGYGMGLKDMDGVEASGNEFIGNRIGIYLDNSPTKVDLIQHFTDNLIAHNDVGVMLLPAVQGNVFSGNAFVENREQVGVAGSGTPRNNDWAANGIGNHWSDFAGYDADGDGLGDIPHRVDDLFSALTDTKSELMIFSGSPAARLIDAAARAFPTLRPEPKAIDPSPLVDLPSFAAPSGASAPFGVTLLGTLLLGLAALIVTAGRPRRELRP